MQIDKHILKRFKNGDPEAFDQVFEKYYRKVYAFSLMTLKNKQDAEEIVQDVFYSLWKGRAKIMEIKDFEAWIFSICLNNIRKHFRRLALEEKYAREYIKSNQESDISPEVDLEYKDLMEKADQLVENLPPSQKTIFLLSKKELMSNLEISRKLNISVRTVDNQLSRAKAHLRRAIFREELLIIILIYYFFPSYL